MDLGKWISKINEDGHMAVGLFVFIIGAGMHYIHGLDASFVAFTTTVLGFLGGHAWVQKGNSDGASGSDNGAK
jgi:hypothetical protein